MIRSAKSIITKIINTQFWQAAFVRPFPSGQDNWKARTGAALAYVFGLLVFVPFSAQFLINDYFVNHIPLSEMPTQTGKLVHISYCHRCENYYLVEGRDGVLYKFSFANGGLIQLKPYMGNTMKVWYQKKYQLPNLWPPFALTRNSTYEVLIEQTNKYINGYEGYRLDRMATDKTDHWWAIAFLLLGFGLPVWIVVKHW